MKTIAMKKPVVALVAALILVLSLGLYGCGGSSSGGSSSSANEAVGTWELSGMEVEGAEMPEEYVTAYVDALGEDNLTITLNEDNSVSMSFAGESADGATYTYADGKGTIESEGQTMDFEIADGKLKLDISGTVMIFSK